MNQHLHLITLGVRDFKKSYKFYTQVLGWKPEGFRSFLETTLMNEPMLGTGAGQWGEEIMITPENLVMASRAAVVNLTEKISL